MLNRALVALGFAVALVNLAFSADKGILDYPLKVQILDTHWQASGSGVVGNGKANLIDPENNQVRGFDYSFGCSHAFNATQRNEIYPAKWKKPEARLLILTTEIGNPEKHHECELKTTLANFIYAMSGGHLTTLTVTQYKQLIEAKAAYEGELHLTDTDPANYPL
jgi:hypothetical protein